MNKNYRIKAEYDRVLKRTHFWIQKRQSFLGIVYWDDMYHRYSTFNKDRAEEMLRTLKELKDKEILDIKYFYIV
jgi:hypothetical protein